MIATAILVVLLVARSVAAIESGTEGRDLVPMIDRLVGPVAVAFIAMLLLRLADLWISNA